MWVQEGSDCKDVDVEDQSPLFSRFYQSRRKKQTTTIIGIPMRPKPKPKPKSKDTKPNITTNTKQKIITKTIKTLIVTPEKKVNEAADEKEMEESETPDLKNIAVEKVSVPVSPAQFIENIGIKEQAQEEQAQEEKEMFIDDYTKDINDFDNDDGDIDIGDPDLDLTIIGKKLAYLFDAVPVFGDVVTNDKSDNDQEKKSSYYIPQAFNGLYVSSFSDWDECINFSNENNNLLIVELYSSIFGPSNVMYTMIDEILHKKENDKIKFVRLNSEKINVIDTIKEIIGNDQFYFSTPIPMYIFIKNGEKVDFLKGTQPKEFQVIIDRHLSQKEEQEKEDKEEEEEIFKYKPLESSSHLSIMNDNKENKSVNGNRNVENIRNLIKKLDIDKKPEQATKLSKKSVSRGMSTKSMFSC